MKLVKLLKGQLLNHRPKNLINPNATVFFLLKCIKLSDTQINPKLSLEAYQSLPIKESLNK